MWYQNNKKEKIISFIKSPFFVAACLFLIILIGLIIVSIINNKTSMENGVYYEYDPASQEEVAFGPPTGAGIAVGPTYVGFSAVLNNGMTADQYTVFRSAVEKYAELEGIQLERVSYLKDSYNLAGLYIFDFDIVLNIDETLLKARVDSSKGWKNVYGMVVKFWNSENEEVYNYELLDENICKEYESCKVGEYEE